jgi:hypothetical protein
VHVSSPELPLSPEMQMSVWISFAFSVAGGTEISSWMDAKQQRSMWRSADPFFWRISGAINSGKRAPVRQWARPDYVSEMFAHHRGRPEARGRCYLLNV